MQDGAMVTAMKVMMTTSKVMMTTASIAKMITTDSAENSFCFTEKLILQLIY